MDSAITVMNEIDIFQAEQATQASRQRLIFPYISIDGFTGAVEAGGVLTHLTTNEFEILYLLACFSGETLSANDIYRSVWQMDDLGNVAPVRVHISNLRHKLWTACPDHKFIVSKWKKGYQFIK